METAEQLANKFVAGIAEAGKDCPGDVVLGVLLQLAANFRTQLTRGELMQRFHNALSAVEQNLPPIPQPAPAPEPLPAAKAPRARRPAAVPAKKTVRH